MATARADNFAIASGAALYAGGSIGAPPVLPIGLGFDGTNPEHICVRCPITGTVPEGTLVRLQHKLVGAQTWRDAMFLSRVRLADLGTLPAAVAAALTNSFVGMAFAVATASTTAATLDVRLAIYPPNSALVLYVTGTHTLRPLAAAAPAVTHNCTPATFAAVLASLPHQSGTDVHLRMGPGTYTWTAQTWGKGGTVGKPVYVSAATLGDAVISTPSGQCLLPQTSFVVMEKLRFVGSGADSGTASSSQWLAIPGGAPLYTDWAIRDCEANGFDVGAKSFAPVRNFDLRRVSLNGNNAWAASFAPNGFGQTGNNATWNDHGICLPGVGNSAVSCTIKGHGDAWRTYANSSFKEFTAGCGMTWCDVVNTGDDMAEFDGSCGNTYVFESRGRNVGNGISADDTYGPVFVIKPLIINPSRGPLKLTSSSFGTRVINGTFAMTVKGPADHGLLVPGGGTQDGFELINCAFHYVGAGNALHWSSGLNRDTWANNAWHPDRNFLINGVASGATLASVKAAHPQRFATDVLLGAQPFAAAITLGANCATEYTGTPTGELANGNAGRSAGVAIAGITDGFSGAAPDIGCAIAGQALPVYGVPVGPTLPSWAPAFSSTQGSVELLTVANGKLANNWIDSVTPWHDGFRWAQTRNAYSGGRYNPHFGPYGAYMYIGQGHSAGNDNAVNGMHLEATQVRFGRITDGSGPFGTGTDGVTKGKNSFANFDHTAAGEAEGTVRVNGADCSYIVDGQPAGHHSYNGLCLIPPSAGGAAKGSLYLPLIGAACRNTALTTSSITSHRLDITSEATPTASRLWAKQFTHPTYPNAMADAGVALGAVVDLPVHTCFDAPTNRVFWQVRKAGFAPRWQVPGAASAAAHFVQGTGAALDASDFTTAAHMAVHIPEKRLWVVLHRSLATGFLKVKYMDLSATQPGWVNSGASLSLSIPVDLDWTAACWCTDSPGGGRILVLDTQGKRGAYFEIQVPTTLQSVWTAEEVQLTQPLLNLLPSGSRSGDNGTIYGAADYAPAAKCVVLCANVSNTVGTPDTVYAMRPRGV